MSLEGFKSTSEITGGYIIPKEYITKFQSLEVDVDDVIAKIGGV